MQLSENEETVVRAMAARGRESIVFREFGPSVSLTEEQVITTLLALKEKGLVEMTRTEAWLTGRGLFQAQQDDQPRRTLTREDILATPDEPDPKTNEEASRRAAEQLPEPFGGVSVPELDQLEDVPTANLGQGFNQRQLDFLAALYRARRNTGTVDWPQVASEYEIDEMLALAFLRKFKERGLVFYQDNPPNVIFHEDGVILADEILQEIGDTILTKDDIFSTPTRSDSFDENLDVHLLMSELDEEERVKAIIRSLDEREERFLLSAYRLADKWGRFNSIAVCQNAGLPERMRGRFCRELKSKALVGGDDYNKSWLEELGARVAEELSEHATPSEPKREFDFSPGHQLNIGHDMAAVVERPAPATKPAPADQEKKPNWFVSFIAFLWKEVIVRIAVSVVGGLILAYIFYALAIRGFDLKGPAAPSGGTSQDAPRVLPREAASQPAD